MKGVGAGWSGCLPLSVTRGFVFSGNESAFALV